MVHKRTERKKDRNMHACGDGYKVREGDIGLGRNAQRERGKKNESPKHSKETHN